MEFKEFKAGAGDSGRRLDKMVKAIFDRFNVENSSQSEIYRLIRKNFIKLNGRKTKPEVHVAENDVISIPAFCFAANVQDCEEQEIQPQDSKMHIPVIYASKDLVFVNKPEGICVQPSAKKTPSLAEIVPLQLKNQGLLQEDSISFKCGPLHRIDTGTSGIVVFSASLKGAREFTQAMQNHAFRKYYLGIVEGKLTETCIWKDRIIAEETDGSHKEFQTVRTGEQGQEAQTTATPLAAGYYGVKDITLVQFEITTGRKHQIRVHSAAHGHPLLGDTAYNGSRLPHGMHHFLHAWKLVFPKDNELELPEEIKAPLPEKFSKFISVNLKNCDCDL